MWYVVVSGSVYCIWRFFIDKQYHVDMETEILSLHDCIRREGEKKLVKFTNQ